MPKFSVYVPDGLWEEVQRTQRGLNMSHVVQDALTRLVGDPATFKRPDLEPERMAGIRSRLQREAQALHEKGYQAGVRASELLDFEQLSRLKYYGWSASREAGMQDILGVLDQATTEVLGEGWRAQPGLVEEGVFVRGWEAALDDVWREVTGEVASSPRLVRTMRADGRYGGAPQDQGGA